MTKRTAYGVHRFSDNGLSRNPRNWVIGNSRTAFSIGGPLPPVPARARTLMHTAIRLMAINVQSDITGLFCVCMCLCVWHEPQRVKVS